MRAQNIRNSTSFLSEHSVEYLLVYNFTRILSLEYKCVVPIYFWATREGTALAASGVEPCNVRLVTVFARRPKVQNSKSTAILMKVNSSLLRAGALGLEFGSPVFAGVPLATGLLQFTMYTPCTWFHLDNPNPSNEDVYVRLDVNGKRCNSSSDNIGLVRGPLTDKELLNAVKNNTRIMTWDVAVQAMRTIRSLGEGERFFLSGYHPFYLVIPEVAGDAV